MSAAPGRWLHFLWLNALSAVLAALVFAFVLEAEFLDGAAVEVARWLDRHPGWAAWAAAAPFVVTVMIGVHYGRKGARKRRAAAARGEPRPKCMFAEEEISRDDR